MVWDQLSINKPHLAYIILGGFTSIFMLVSLYIKEKLYIGEASVATICGLIFGPHAANLVNPLTWGNTDQITLEFSRIVLVVQCFAVGVELPKAYMERHWLSVVLLLIPVMTFGWLVTSLFIWWMIIPLSWLESLCVAACVTATDPVLASSVVGKGKFAKRVPKHIRDLLSAESGCNDGMAFPFVYLALNLIHYNLDAKHVIQHWFCNTILYECVWGAVYGVLVGYIARQAIRWAENKGIIDRESFLVFYFVLALFCAGSGSLLGMDDLLVGFAAGVGFSNDGWFLEKTEESHVSNVIDLLLNLTYFVYLGTIIPWEQYNSGLHGLKAWRLVVIALLVVFFRRIPIMLMLKPIIPDIKTWREALFCGHFGPIGVGAIFVAILARAELETSGTTPLAVLPDPSDAEYVLIYTIWPITTFLVMTSIVVHGSSIAVFTLGKRINTLTMTLSYTTGNENSSNWMERLPRIASRSKSEGRSYGSEYSEDEKADVPPGQLPPVGIPKLALRRQKEDDSPYGRPQSRSRSKRRKKKSMGAGGPISDSAIMPRKNSEPLLAQQESGSDTLNEKSERPSPDRLDSEQTERQDSRDSDHGSRQRRTESPKTSGGKGRSRGQNDDVDVEAYDEGGHLIVEDEEGNVLKSVDTGGKSEEEKLAIVEETKNQLRKDTSGNYAKHKHEPHERDEGSEIEEDVAHAIEHPEKNFREHFKHWTGFGKAGNINAEGGPSKKQPERERERKRGPAHAYQYGNTIIVEDEDGEVIHKYDIPVGDRDGNRNNDYRQRMQRMGTWVGLNRRQSQAVVPVEESISNVDDEEDISTTSHEKSQVGPKPGKGINAEPKQAARGEVSKSKDDGLRMVISNAEQYGLTGLRKPRAGARPGVSESGRRMSTQDFVRHMQNLDKKTRQEAMSEAGVSSKAQHEINKSTKAKEPSGAGEERPNASSRISALPISNYKTTIEEEEEPKDYFSAKQASLPTVRRLRSRSDTTGTQLAEPMDTQNSKLDATDSAAEEEVEAVPSHDVRSTIARHGKGNMTSADTRRQRYTSAPESGERIDEDEEEDDPNEETAAEKRRRLAALGLGGGGDDSESDSSDEEEPRVPKLAVQEPGVEDESSPVSVRREIEQRSPPREREQLAQPPRMRVQWGGETRGVVRGKGSDDVEAETGSGSAQRSPGGGLGKKLGQFWNK